MLVSRSLGLVLVLTVGALGCAPDSEHGVEGAPAAGEAAPVMGGMGSPSLDKKLIAPKPVSKPAAVKGSKALIGEEGKQLQPQGGKALVGEDGKQALIGEDGKQLAPAQPGALIGEDGKQLQAPPK
ncbi:MAG: hypothetical protein KC457_23985 [Myxococcales bacterium]|nr:hypothetical protein [Myxococcales bacterium]